MKHRICSVVVVFVLASVGANAHDFWLAANPARPAPGARVTVTANVGDHFPKGTNYPPPGAVDRWQLIGADGEIKVMREFRKEGESLATDVTLPSAGAYLGVMTVVARTIDMKGPEFTDYLKEEGLDQIIASRQASGQADKNAKERYARYAKLALRSGDGSAAHLTRAIGLKAEFVPSTDPSSVKVGETLTVQLLAEGKPVSDAAVTALSSAAGPPVKGRTDGNGRVTMTIDREGAWLIKTVHMTTSPSPDADFESYWVTLAFHAAGSPTKSEARRN